MAMNSSGGRGFAGALHAFNSLVSLVGCVLLVPRLWPLVDGHLWAALAPIYSHEIAGWLHLGVWIALWPITYFALRMALSALVGALALAIAKRAM